jgi:hypothetical protein
MGYFSTSARTLSYWRYAIFSQAAGKTFLAAMGALYLLINVLDTFGIYAKTQYTKYEIFVFLLVAVAWTLGTRRPVSKITYKIPKRDFSIEVRIGDIFSLHGEIVVSSNTTFDTDMSSGLIATSSMQGQFALRMFKGQTDEIDKQISESLKGQQFEEVSGKPGKLKKYPVGTVAKVSAYGKNFYFVAMSDMNEHGNAVSSVAFVDKSLESVWRYMVNRGELGNLVVPLMGTGRGRIELPRKKMIERIAQSFADASRERVFSNRLVIVIYPGDVERFGINLFEVRDYLSQSLHI